MTLKKYKKLLMSCGLDRDLAEALRKNRAYNRTLPDASELEGKIRSCEEIAGTFRNCNGSLKKLRHLIAQSLKMADRYLKDGGTV